MVSDFISTNVERRMGIAGMLRCVVSCLALAATMAPCCWADERAQELPNILWLTAEDIGPHLGCYGDRLARTPRLDAFANRGLRYDLAWSNYPVCAPARTTIITGMYAAATGAGHMRSSVPLPDSILDLPELLQQAGYYCTNNRKEDYNHPRLGTGWHDSSGNAHWKNRPDGTPFFAVFNYTGTHESQIRKRPRNIQTNPAYIQLPPYHPDCLEVRRDWAQYYDNIADMDRWFGRQLQDLTAAGLADDTIIVFFGDHGAGMPRHKRFAGDSGLRIPLLIHIPAKFAPLSETVQPATIQSPFCFVDLAPTMLSLAGLQPPHTMQGRALLGELRTEPRQYAYGFRDRMDERCDMSRSLRDDRFVYIRNYLPHRPHGQFITYQYETATTRFWRDAMRGGDLTAVQRRFWQPRCPEELYDLDIDPHETRNLYCDVEYADVLERFRGELRRHTLEIRDVQFVPEPELVSLARSTTPYEFARDEGNYELKEVFTIADQATDPTREVSPWLLAALENSSPTIRYWAAMACLIHGSLLIESDLQQGQRLVARLGDSSAAVRIAAAEALATHGNSVQRDLAIATLLHDADLRNTDFRTAVVALNALDAVGDLSPQQVAAVWNLPVRDEETRRSGAAVEDLVRRIVATSVFHPDQSQLPVEPPSRAIRLLSPAGPPNFVGKNGDVPDWPLEHGVFTSQKGDTRSNHIASNWHFRDADIHVEFELPSSGDGNSGVYIHGNYELQIKRTDPGDPLNQHSLGAFYGYSPPSVNASRPPGQWQVYDIRYFAPRRNDAGDIYAKGRITAWLNGAKIQNNVEFGEPRSHYHPFRHGVTDYLRRIAQQQKLTSVGPVFLQDHDNPVRFRNVWIRPLDSHHRPYQPGNLTSD